MTDLPLGLVGLEGGSDPLRHGGGPRVRLFLLDPQEGVRVQVPHGDGEALGELLAGGQLAVQEVLAVAVDVLTVVGRLAGEGQVREVKVWELEDY